MKRFFFSIVMGGLLLAWASLPSGCANIVPPSGGPRDSLPPQLVSAVPADSTLQFRGSEILLTFNEYIDLQDVQNNLLFTPLFNPNTTPEVAVQGREIRIRFREALDSNTTYILNFGNAIKDYNEGNVLRDFTYAFSTGPALDTGTLSGRVILAHSGAIDTTIAVVLHRSLEDSAVRMQTPRYAARLDRNGAFRFRNLAAGTYAIYAIGDAGTVRRYTNERSQYFAFADAPVQPGSDSSITLYAYREAAPTTAGGFVPGRAAPGNRDNRLVFSTSLEANQLDLLRDFTLTFTTPLRRFDSSKVSLRRDTLFTPVPFTASLDTASKIVTIRTSWNEGTAYHLIFERDFAEDTAGRMLLKGDTLSFMTRKAADYGSLVLRVRGLDTAASAVVQFVQNDVVVQSYPIPGGVLNLPRVAPGDYDLRILYDRNGNGRWDWGKFFGEKRQPEIVRPIREKITVKAAWDNEMDRSL